MNKEEAIQKAESFLKGCYEFWEEAERFISEDECDAIEFLINKVKESE